MKVIAPISSAAGIHSADKLVLVKHGHSEGHTVQCSACWSGGVAYKTTRLRGECNTDTDQAGIIRFCKVSITIH